VSFVDAWIGHVPLYPKSLSVTLAVWSARFPTTWRDRLRRLRIFQGREQKMRNIAVKLGLRKQLELKVVESFDYYPVERGFRVMRERKEFERGPNADHLASVFHVLQETGNEHLSRTVRRVVDEGRVTGKARALELNALLERGPPIEGCLTKGLHYDIPYANFTRDDIERSLRAVAPPTKTRGENDGCKLATETGREASAGAGPR
jgi:hypothetical protein